MTSTKILTCGLVVPCYGVCDGEDAQGPSCENEQHTVVHELMCQLSKEHIDFGSDEISGIQQQTTPLGTNPAETWD